MEIKYQSVIRFFTEAKNEEQLSIAYTEIEVFKHSYEDFLFYYTFDTKNILDKYYDHLSSELK